MEVTNVFNHTVQAGRAEDVSMRSMTCPEGGWLSQAERDRWRAARDRATGVGDEHANERAALEHTA
eukprot:scaffold232412_cov43-Prasinocladus_malaysianus.AAC.1